MRHSGRVPKHRYSLLGIMVLTVILTAATACQVKTTGSTQSSATPTNEQDWKTRIAQTSLPKKGCFTATYPKLDWRDVTCTSTPTYPQPPAGGARPQVVGNGTDVSARVPSGFISTAIGSFDTVTGVTSESGPIANTGPPIANAYTLQLNPNFFATTACAGSPNAGCQGWQQFVFENYGTGGRAYIQYWLTAYNTTCPGGVGWIQIPLYGGIYCWKNNTAGAVPVPNQPITNLGQLSLAGSVSATSDSIVLYVGTTAYSTLGDNAVNAAGGWNTAEFNVFGDGGNSSGASRASFNAGSAITVRTRTLYGGTAAPMCVATGFTAETNNLSFGLPRPGASPPGPAVEFFENSAGGASSPCAAGTTIGDTHLTTFNGLQYDFQASGDFLLAQADRDFVVHARQVSGAPTWPDATINSAVATKMGSTRVALCTAQGGLVVDGTPTDVADGATIALASGVDIYRTGNVYLVTDQQGDSIRATLNTTWIDVSVGLGTWPTKVRGLLANPDGNVKLLQAHDGTVFDTPISFDDLYGKYGESWRVAPPDSLLSDCGREVEHGNPTKPFFANNLDQGTRDRAGRICVQAGVKEGALLDACTLDVAVLGEKAAAAYVGATPPIAVGDKH
jgi:von Willebrand factor type D domain